MTIDVVIYISESSQGMSSKSPAIDEFPGLIPAYAKCDATCYRGRGSQPTPNCGCQDMIELECECEGTTMAEKTKKEIFNDKIDALIGRMSCDRGQKDYPYGGMSPL